MCSLRLLPCGALNHSLPQVTLHPCLRALAEYSWAEVGCEECSFASLALQALLQAAELLEGHGEASANCAEALGHAWPALRSNWGPSIFPDIEARWLLWIKL